MRLLASISAGQRELNGASVDVEGASRQAAGLLVVELAKLADAKLARQEELDVGKLAATDEKSLANALKMLMTAAHNDEVTLLLAERNSAAAQRPDIWHEKASSLGSTAGDLVQLGLSLIGTADPTGIADSLNGFISLARGNYADAALSFASAVPAIGTAGNAVMNSRLMMRVSRVFGSMGRRVVSTAVAINRRLDCNDVNRVFSLAGKVLGKCFVGNTLVLVGEYERGQTVAIVDAEISTELPLIAPQNSESRWPALLWLIVGVAGVVIVSDRKRNQVPALTHPKRGPRLEPVGDPPDDPLPPQLTPEELDTLCDELFGVSDRRQSSRHTPWDDSRTSNRLPLRNEPLSVIGTSQCSSATLALAEKPIMRTELQQLEQPTSKPRRSRARNILAGVWGTFFGLMALWSFFGAPTPSVTNHVTARPVIAAKAETPPALFQVNAETKPRFAAKAIRDIQPIADRVIAKSPEQELDDNDSTEMELVDLSAAELAELEAELIELIESEPLPALIDGISDDTELVAFNDDEVELTDDTNDLEPTKAELLYDELLAAASVLAPQSSPLTPELTDYGPFVREHWRVIHFTLTRPDGDQVRIWLARPTWWLEAEQVKAGGKYEFDMEEVGAVGTADVVAIDECQQPPNRQNEHHRLVTGKFEHEATNVIDLYVEGQDEPIGTTANHPFWSEDRQAFVEAESLRPGENVLNAEGQRIQVITHSARPGPQTVYNLEVDGEHVYMVTSDGLLVHNNCNSTLLGNAMTAARKIRQLHTAAHHIVAATAKGARQARKILKQAGIDVNSAVNGVFLAKNGKVPNLVGGAVHSVVHTQKYYRYVNQQVINAWNRGGKAAVERTLRRLGRDLANGRRIW